MGARTDPTSGTHLEGVPTSDGSAFRATRYPISSRLVEPACGVAFELADLVRGPSLAGIPHRAYSAGMPATSSERRAQRAAREAQIQSTMMLDGEQAPAPAARRSARKSNARTRWSPP